MTSLCGRDVAWRFRKYTPGDKELAKLGKEAIAWMHWEIENPLEI